MQYFGDTWTVNPVEYIHKSSPLLLEMFEKIKLLYPNVSQIIENIKPDLIIFDQLFALPYGKEEGIPWVNLFSAAMNFTAGHPKMPPPQSGLPTEYNPENARKWQEFIDKAYKGGPYKEFKDQVSNFLKEHNCPSIDGEYNFNEISPYLNIYCYPKELDYQEENDIKLPGNWVRIESPVTEPFSDPFPVPDNLKNLPGKLIYFSLGKYN
jgi:hypothetical protein